MVFQLVSSFLDHMDGHPPSILLGRVPVFAERLYLAGHTMASICLWASRLCPGSLPTALSPKIRQICSSIQGPQPFSPSIGGMGGLPVDPLEPVALCHWRSCGAGPLERGDML